MAFIVVVCYIQCETLDSIGHLPALPISLRLATRLKPRILVPVERLVAYLLAIFKRVDIEHPARIHALFYLSGCTVLLVPYARIIGIRVVIIEILEVPVDAVGVVELVRVGEGRATVRRSGSISLRKDVGDIEASE